MHSRNSVTRRRFMGGAAAALGYAGLSLPDCWGGIRRAARSA